LKKLEMLTSVVCRYDHFETPWLANQVRRLSPGPGQNTPPALHRKIWEWCAIAQALEERDMLRSGRKGLGFAVGKEPLTSLFAGLGVEVIATDLSKSGINPFEISGEHAAELNHCFHAALVKRADFDRLVRFEPADMRDLSNFTSESVDFVWSSCAMEHLGSLEAGIDYVMNSTRLLKPGGVSINTTEFNLGLREIRLIIVKMSSTDGLILKN
jgi:Methyltransferase domain